MNFKGRKLYFRYFLIKWLYTWIKDLTEFVKLLLMFKYTEHVKYIKEMYKVAGKSIEDNGAKHL